MHETDEFPLLASQGLYASAITGDGNCLFRALSDQLYGSPERHTHLRTEVVQFLRDNKAQFISFLPAASAYHGTSGAPRKSARRAATGPISGGQPTEKMWETYLDMMTKDGVYGDNLEIVAFAKRFNVDVKIHLADFAYVVSGESSNGGESACTPRKVLHVAYHQWEHYSSIRNVDGPHSGLPEVREMAITQETTSKLLETHKYCQPWMEKVVLSSLPDLVLDNSEGLKLVRETIEQFKGDVNQAVEYLFEQQNDDVAEMTDENKHDSPMAVAPSGPATGDRLYTGLATPTDSQPSAAEILSPDNLLSPFSSTTAIHPSSSTNPRVSRYQTRKKAAAAAGSSPLSNSCDFVPATPQAVTKPKSKQRKETARERKERQKRESKERRKQENQRARMDDVPKDSLSVASTSAARSSGISGYGFTNLPRIIQLTRRRRLLTIVVLVAGLCFVLYHVLALIDRTVDSRRSTPRRLRRPPVFADSLQGRLPPPQLRLPSAKDSLATGFDPETNRAIQHEVQQFKQNYDALHPIAADTKDSESKIKISKELATDTMPQLSITSKARMTSGYDMPLLGFGVYMSYGGEAIDSVYHALKVGYRHIDSATLYENEREVGVAIKKWIHDTGGKREDVFFTTKVWDTDQGYNNTKKAINWSLRQCDLGYIDLYLVHSPYPGREMRRETWKAMEEAVEEGKIRSIGVSNYGIKHLKEMESYANIKPAVNQLEIHPFLTRKELVDYCQAHDIVVEAFCPITRGQKFKDPRVQALVKKYSRTPAQILLRWSLQRGLVPLPKSSNPKRIEENSKLFDFEIEPHDMETLMTNEYYIIDWDPTNVA
ncbi:NADP-dependent oxidoreductase domain-containing protein [Lipomyces tetrasporus]|uniref:NADP-dependent oxidoreductase domain-containing protein n=1 Tax=Lipomyces tetrasporus TaxID=54092 RepID=A0AAD7QXT5_9ASCO|nr:NADP-dependent oxidoreductase domain-containing protein [Lipomyces tetrasporus]KAJ8102936.1 NADP-dependent oxidoreductase domain-containing protein [Lipomyces tetrasporus]